MMRQELFYYSVLTTKADSLKSEPVCINNVLEQSLIGLYGLLSDRGSVPDIQMTDEKVIRQLNAEALRRVFDNILSNARQVRRRRLNGQSSAGWFC
jgi:signal transduction histidine kinase